MGGARVRVNESERVRERAKWNINVNSLRHFWGLGEHEGNPFTLWSCMDKIFIHLNTSYITRGDVLWTPSVMHTMRLTTLLLSIKTKTLTAFETKVSMMHSAHLVVPCCKTDWCTLCLQFHQISFVCHCWKSEWNKVTNPRHWHNPLPCLKHDEHAMPFWERAKLTLASEVSILCVWFWKECHLLPQVHLHLQCPFMTCVENCVLKIATTFVIQFAPSVAHAFMKLRCVPIFLDAEFATFVVAMLALQAEEQLTNCRDWHNKTKKHVGLPTKICKTSHKRIRHGGHFWFGSDLCIENPKQAKLQNLMANNSKCWKASFVSGEAMTNVQSIVGALTTAGAQIAEPKQQTRSNKWSQNLVAVWMVVEIDVEIRLGFFCIGELHCVGTLQWHCLCHAKWHCNCLWLCHFCAYAWTIFCCHCSIWEGPLIAFVWATNAGGIALPTKCQSMFTLHFWILFVEQFAVLMCGWKSDCTKMMWTHALCNFKLHTTEWCVHCILIHLFADENLFRQWKHLENWRSLWNAFQTILCMIFCTIWVPQNDSWDNSRNLQKRSCTLLWNCALQIVGFVNWAIFAQVSHKDAVPEFCAWMVSVLDAQSHITGNLKMCGVPKWNESARSSSAVFSPPLTTAMVSAQVWLWVLFGDEANDLFWSWLEPFSLVMHCLWQLAVVWTFCCTYVGLVVHRSMLNLSHCSSCHSSCCQLHAPCCCDMKWHQTVCGLVMGAVESAS